MKIKKEHLDAYKKTIKFYESKINRKLTKEEKKVFKKSFFFGMFYALNVYTEPSLSYIEKIIFFSNKLEEGEN